MKKNLFFLMLLPCLLGYAQIERGMKGSYDTEFYPKVSFTLNEKNPNRLDKTDFKITENGVPVVINEVTPLSPNIPKRSKNILILWEDMASHQNQYRFANKVITEFLNQVDPNDKFNIATFNRKKDANPAVLQPLLTGFTKDKTLLLNAVNSYRKKNERFYPYPESSDLYLAINEGVTMLNKLPDASNNIQVIIVITAGLSIKASGANTDILTPIAAATNADIPVYMIKYKFRGDTPEVNMLTEKTFGERIATTDANLASTELKKYYDNMTTRHYGHDYKITFTSQAKRDGQPKEIKLSVASESKIVVPFQYEISILEWFKANFILFIIGVVVLVVVVIVIIQQVAKNKNKQRRIEFEMQRIANEADYKIAVAEQQAEQDRLNRMRIDEAQRNKEENEKRRVENERLANLMQTRNLYPRLQYMVGNENKSFTIQKPLTTIGRLAPNDLALGYKTVSQEHARIVFNGAGFEIINLSKTNQILLNGKFVQSAALKSGDRIGVGEVTLNFYL